MRLIKFIFLIFLSYKLYAGENLYWSNTKDGPSTVQEAKALFGTRALEPIEGIWFSEHFTTVIFKSGDIFKEYIITTDDKRSKRFEKSWEGTYQIIDGNYFSFFKRVWYLTYDGQIQKLRTQTGIGELIGNRFFDLDYFKLSESGYDMDYSKTKVWPINTEHSSDELNHNELENNVQAFGTGFFINNDGFVVTNHHVIESCNRISISNNNYSGKAKVLASDKQIDLALLDTGLNNKNFIKISDNKLKKLQKIIAAGYPFGVSLSNDLKFTSGIISSLKGYDNNTSQIQIDAALNPGNSGGPIIDEKTGELVAIAVSILRKDVSEGINFGIKSSALEIFLESNDITINNAQHNSTDILENIELSTLNIICE